MTAYKIQWKGDNSSTMTLKMSLERFLGNMRSIVLIGWPRPCDPVLLPGHLVVDIGPTRDRQMYRVGLLPGQQDLEG